MTKDSIVEFKNLRGNAAKFVTKETTGNDAACIKRHIDLKLSDGTIMVGWNPSSADLHALDWYIVKY
jgi:hypothetical protein